MSQATPASHENVQHQREQAALGKLAAAQQRTMDANITAEQAERTRKLLEAQMGYQAGMETAMSGLQGAAAAGIGAGTQIADNRSTPDDTDDIYQGITLPEVVITPKAEDITADPNQTAVQGFEDSLGIENMSGMGEGFDFQKVLDVIYGVNEEGLYYDEDYYKIKKQGGSVKLKGEFDHSTNPKYVYDKNGNVEAEMTGDETLVFNPKQRRFLKKVLKDLMSKGKATANKAEANKTFKAFK